MLKFEWVDRAREAGLYFFFSNDIFTDDVTCRLMGNDKLKIPIDSEKTILCISGFNFNIYNDVVEFMPTIHNVGDKDLGYGRTVYEFVGADSNIPIRAGLTVHDTFGTWSSWPPHQFEQESFMRPVADDFDEKFAIVTNPPGGWGVCTQTGYFDSEISGYASLENRNVTFNDRDIITMPLGSHPICGGPGVQLAYFWAFQTKSLRFTEKFSKGKRT